MLRSAVLVTVWCGSCNGLVRLSTYDDTARSYVDFIDNCSTREFERIPYYEPFVVRDSSLDASCYAQLIDDFKVFGVSDRFNEVDADVIVNVFSLRNNTWKTFEINDFVEFREDLRAILLNGTIHFGFSKLNFDDHFMIAAFDLVEDKFKFVALTNNIMYSFSIRSMGDCLCLFPRTTDWQKEYGVKESWTRISSANSILFLQPLFTFKDSDLFLSLFWKKPVIFNPKDGSYEDFISDAFEEDLYDCNLVAFGEPAESLISPSSRTNFQSEGASDLEFRTETVKDPFSYQLSW